MEPTEGKLYAPADGKITVAFPTGHAYGLRTEDGLDLLMHIGMDTVELDGKHFTPKRSLRATPSSAAMSSLSLIFRDQGSRLPAGHPLVITNSRSWPSRCRTLRIPARL